MLSDQQFDEASGGTGGGGLCEAGTPMGALLAALVAACANDNDKVINIIIINIIIINIIIINIIIINIMIIIVAAAPTTTRWGRNSNSNDKRNNHKHNTSNHNHDKYKLMKAVIIINIPQ
jgi:hypothetical protein